MTRLKDPFIHTFMYLLCSRHCGVGFGGISVNKKLRKVLALMELTF